MLTKNKLKNSKDRWTFKIDKKLNILGLRKDVLGFILTNIKWIKSKRNTPRNVFKHNNSIKS